MKKLSIYALAVFSIGMLSCSDDDKSFDVPTNYEFQRNGETTVSYGGQTTRIQMAEELITAMKDENSSTVLLKEMFANQTESGGDANPYSSQELNESTKSIKSKVAASKDFFSANTVESTEIKADFESWIQAHVDEVYPNYSNLAEAGKAGQIADGSSVRYVNAKGLEYNQAVNKSLIGALMVDQILNNYLSSSVLDDGDNIKNNDDEVLATDKNYTTMEHKWDEAYGYLFGTSSDGASPLANLGEDSFLNKYLARVEGDEDFAGIAQTIFDAFKKGRAAIVAQEYGERDKQVKILREEISKVIAIRAVYYLQQGKNGLPTSGNDYGPSFHDLSEGFGFVYSLRFTRKPDSNESYFSQNEVDQFVSQLTTGNGFWDVTPATLDAISESIASKFDFTVAQAGE